MIVADPPGSAAILGVQREFSQAQNWHEPFNFGNATLIHADCFDWIEKQEPNTFHAVVTDPPYGLHEYTPEQQTKLRKGKGGVWRIPPSYDGHTRSPLPRFTTLTPDQLEQSNVLFHLGTAPAAEACAWGTCCRRLESSRVLHCVWSIN